MWGEGCKRAVSWCVRSVKCKWRTSDTVSFFPPPCLLVAERKSWSARQAGAYGVIVRIRRDAVCGEWKTFPGNSCQIHPSRAEDRIAGLARPHPDTRLVEVDSRGGAHRIHYISSWNAERKGLCDGWPHWALTGVSTPRQLIVYHIAHLFYSSRCRFYAQQHSTHTQQCRGTHALSGCHSPTQHLSMVHHCAWQGMQTTWRGISTTPIVWGQYGAGFGCMAIEALYFYSLALDRDAERPHFCSPAVSECVHVMPPAKSLIISVDMTRKGVMVDSVIAVCCTTCRLDLFFNGLGRCLLLMYNLLLIHLTL